MALIGKAAIVRGVDDARAAAQHSLRAEDAALNQIRVRRDADVAAKNADEMEQTQPAMIGQRLEAHGLREIRVEKIARHLDDARVVRASHGG
jgi:hypothetical protein